MDCKCIACEIRELLDRRFPDGQTVDSAVEVGEALADLAGQVLAAVGEGSFNAFVAMVRQAREMHRQSEPKVLHS